MAALKVVFLQISYVSFYAQDQKLREKLLWVYFLFIPSHRACDVSLLWTPFIG